MLNIRNLTFTYPNKSPIFQNFNIKFEHGINCVLGKNGSGKSTLFHLICDHYLAILHKKTSLYKHTISLPKNFKLSFTAQNYREVLLPWYTVLQNMALPLKLDKNTYKSDLEVKNITQHFLEKYNFTSFNINLNSKPTQLSGGQAQVVNFFRSMVTNPNMWLLDEPFSALDLENSLKLRQILKDYTKQNPETIIILISHNLDDVFDLAKQVFVINETFEGKVLNLKREELDFENKLKEVVKSVFRK